MTTWEQVRDAEDKAQQMAGQTASMGFETVMQFARVGQMLIELKEVTRHGEFLVKAKSISLLDKRLVQLRMKLAVYLPLLEQHRPKDQQSALKLIKDQNPPKPRKPKALPTPVKDEDEMKNFNTGLILVLTGLSDGNNGPATTARKEMIARFGEESINTKEKYMAAAKQLAAEKKCIDRFKEETKLREEIDKLSKSAQLQIAKAEAALLKKLEADFNRRVREAADAMIPDRIAIYEEAKRKADIAEMRFLAMSSGISAHITQHEYRILRSVVHSDKPPTDEQKNEAFHIVQKIGDYVKAVA